MPISVHYVIRPGDFGQSIIYILYIIILGKNAAQVNEPTFVTSRENLNNREGHSECTISQIFFTSTSNGIRGYPKFQF